MFSIFDTILNKKLIKNIKIVVKKLLNKIANSSPIIINSNKYNNWYGININSFIVIIKSG